MGEYLGKLPERDPLYSYLRYEIQPQLCGVHHPVYRVFRMNASNDVYLYEEKHSGSRCIGKFFLSAQQNDPEAAARRLDREYHHLDMMRRNGFSGGWHYIARPLGRNDFLNKLLAVEFCGGELLSSILSRGIRDRDDGLIYAKLTALAWFLARFHNRTAQPERVDFQEACSYLDLLCGQLRWGGVIGSNSSGEIAWLRDRWREQAKMWSDCRVFVHGDATPENFLFGDGLHVISFDLERLRCADRIFDTGRIAGEIKHFFLAATGNRYAAEPFIGHFLWEYACHFPDRERTFQETTRRVPFYMGATLLRIARNSWLDFSYRRQLVYEAKECLRRWML